MKSQVETIQAVETVAVKKAGLLRCPTKLIILSIMAGAFIALGGCLSVLAGCSTANPISAKFLSGFAFPIGLFLVVSFGAELFTGNNAVLIPATYSRKISGWDLVANWVMVWVGNFIGALLFSAVLLKATGICENEVFAAALDRIFHAKINLSWVEMFCRAIGANWCVCMAVWIAASVSSLPAKTIACWVPVAAFVILGYEHSIANMFFLPTAIMCGTEPDMSGLFFNLLVVTLGNIVGGALCVGCVQTYLHASRTTD